ncbi:hypothetical protein [Streptomyces alanosinicus]|nr:hypothetical protein [Streptomyces alanosinicus]
MDRSLASVRPAPLLLLAAPAGAAAGLLFVQAGDGTAGGVLAGLTAAGGAVLAGLTAAGGAVPLFHQAIAPDTTPSRPAVPGGGAGAGAKGGGSRG